MNTNAKRWTCGVLCGWLLTTAPARVEATNVGYALHIASAAVTQTAASGSRREADELLRRARAAMDEGNLQLAHWCLDRVAKLDVKYDGLFQRFGDTPVKLRRDLEKLEQQTAAADNSGTSQASSAPADTDRAITAATPLAPNPSALTAPSPPAANTGPTGQVIRNPYVNPSTTDRAPATAGAVPVRTPAGLPPAAAAAMAAASPAQKSQVSQLLATARAALDRGDIGTAERLAQQAHALKVPDHEFEPGQVRPWMLLLEIDRAKRSAKSRVPRRDPPTTACVLRCSTICRTARASSLRRPRNRCRRLVQLSSRPVHCRCSPRARRLRRPPRRPRPWR